MRFALGAGKLFSISSPSEFENTIIMKCIDTYIALNVLHNPPTPASTTKDGSSMQCKGGDESEK